MSSLLAAAVALPLITFTKKMKQNTKEKEKMKTINKLKAKVEELHKFIEGNTMLSVKISASSYPLQIKFYESQIDLLSEEAPPRFRPIAVLRF